MDTQLIERYIEAVKTFLPGAQRDDIGRELMEDLYTRIEAREAALGRPLTEVEQEGVIKQFGNPALVAGRYHAGHASVSFGRQLIGPELFPLYIWVLGISLGFMLVGRLIALRLLGDPVVEGLFGYVVTHFVVVTAIFALAQYQLTRHPERWNPRDPLSPMPTIKDPLRVSRTEMIIELVITAVILMWLRSLANVTDLSVGPFTIAPIWRQVYLPVVGLTALAMVPPAVLLFRPRWLGFRLGARLVLDLAWMVLMVIVLQAGEWVTLTVASPELAPVLATINQYTRLGLIISLAITAAYWLWSLYALLRHLRGRAEPAGVELAVI